MFVKLVVVAALVAFTAADGSKNNFSASFNAAKKTYEISKDLDGDAYATYMKNYNKSGWNFLDVKMETEITSQTDHLIHFHSFGFLEGFTTCSEIKTFYPNFYSNMFGTDEIGSNTIKFVEDNYNWLKQNADEKYLTDDYWYTVATILAQLDGLYEGYVSGCGSTTSDTPNYRTLESATLTHFLLLHSWGDLYQITKKLQEPGMNSRLRGNRDSKYKNEAKQLVNRCSAIVKLLPDYSDVVYGHNTWDSYESMSPRIMKHYRFPLWKDGKVTQQFDVHFSSYPGVLSSIDDFFLVSGYAQLGVQETTNDLYNLKLLEKVVPESVLSWTRAMASNQLATSGADWAQVYARYHSGTYTNQYMTLDLNLFTPGSAPSAGFFTVFEEVPGLVHIEDQTATLVADGYWGSYNSPVYADMAEASGYSDLCNKGYEGYCHDKCPRHNIFQAHQSEIKGISGIEWMLSYNQWQTDALSTNDSCNAIACRGDLEPQVIWRGAYGALDVKVTSATLSKFTAGTSEAPTYYARLGPTQQDQEVFCWSQLKDEDEYSHQGHPDCFDFQFQVFPAVM